MKDRKKQIRLTDILSHIGARTIAAALVVFVITIGIAALVGIRFYDTEKEVLQLQGKQNAKEAAVEYDKCLVTRVNIVTMVGCTVDDMIALNARNSRIENYLKEQTDNVIETMDPDTTGLYGWINREYLDGSGWEPDEDYVATERPWYTQTLESDQKITFVDPYPELFTAMNQNDFSPKYV